VNSRKAKGKRLPRPTRLARTVRDVGAQALADALGVHPQTVRRWAREGTTKARRASVFATVLDPKLVMAGKAAKFYRAAEKAHRIKAPKDSAGFGKTKHVDLINFEGSVSTRRVRTPLTPAGEETITLAIEKIAKKLARKSKGGRYYVTFGLYEYGRRVAGSPGSKMYKDKEGEFYSSYDATIGANSITGAIEQARMVMGKLLEETKSAVIVDSVSVKLYREKSSEEGWAFREARPKRTASKLSKAVKAAKAKAAKAKAGKK
jgi:hypothetical protein